MLNIALPKGRLGEKVYELFSSIGYDCAAIREDNRKLVFENPANDVRYRGGHRRCGQGCSAGNKARCI